MRLTIIPKDKTVYKDGLSFSQLNWEGTPDNVHAVQWFTNKGWIEFASESEISNDRPANEEINELPQWALNALEAWRVAYEISITPVEIPSGTVDATQEPSQGQAVQG